MSLWFKIRDITLSIERYILNIITALLPFYSIYNCFVVNTFLIFPSIVLILRNFKCGLKHAFQGFKKMYSGLKFVTGLLQYKI